MNKNPCVAHEAPEPAQALLRAILIAVQKEAPLPHWFSQHSLTLTSPTARQMLWALGRRLTRNPDVGFAVAAHVPEDALGSLWALYEAAPSLRALHRAYNDWSGLLLDFVEVHVIDEGPITWLRFVPRDGITMDRAEQDFRASMLVKTWRRLHTDAALTPSAAHFTYAYPGTVRAHERALGTRDLRFGQSSMQLGLSRGIADAPMGRSRAAEFERLRLEARARAAGQSSLAERVEALITERLAHGPHAGEIAQRLGLSVRSLRRHLRSGSDTFRALLERARRRERDLYLEAMDLPVAEIARLLGFSGDGALRNSMRRADSLNPSARRRRT